MASLDCCIIKGSKFSLLRKVNYQAITTRVYCKSRQLLRFQRGIAYRGHSIRLNGCEQVETHDHDGAKEKKEEIQLHDVKLFCERLSSGNMKRLRQLPFIARI